MDNCNMTGKRTSVIIPGLALLVALPVAALPEDSQQPIHGTYDNSLLLLDEGIQVFYGKQDAPAQITQGTLKITGQEITIERQDGEVRKVTVSGSPAHYQQQPAVDQPIVTAEGDTLVLDYEAQQLSADGSVRFTQGKNLWTGCHVDYDIDTRRLTTPPCENGEQSKAILVPGETP